MANNIYESEPYELGENKPDNSGKKGFAIASLVMSIISLILCCCMGFNLILAIPALIFGIISLVKHRGGKGMAIAGIIISTISIIVTSCILVIYGPMYSDIVKVASNLDEIYETFEETGEIPDYLEKYTDEKYDSVWKQAGYDDFYDYFGSLLEEMENGDN